MTNDESEIKNKTKTTTKKTKKSESRTRPFHSIHTVKYSGNDASQIKKIKKKTTTTKEQTVTVAGLPTN